MGEARRAVQSGVGLRPGPKGELSKANRIFFLNTMSPDNVVDMIKEGVMIGAANQRAAEIGRQYTKREMPW